MIHLNLLMYLNFYRKKVTKKTDTAINNFEQHLFNFVMNKANLLALWQLGGGLIYFYSNEWQEFYGKNPKQYGDSQLQDQW